MSIDLLCSDRRLQIACVLCVLNLFSLQISEILALFTDNILAVWEESLKSIIRESFNVGTRSTDTFFSWCLRVCGKDPGDTGDKTKAWQAWWQEDRQSSLNAFIASHSPSKRLRKSSNHYRFESLGQLRTSLMWLQESSLSLRALCHQCLYSAPSLTDTGVWGIKSIGVWS